MPPSWHGVADVFCKSCLHVFVFFQQALSYLLTPASHTLSLFLTLVVHRRTQALVPTSVGALMAVARRPAAHTALWAVHALTLCAQSAGLAYMTHVAVSGGCRGVTAVHGLVLACGGRRVAQGLNVCCRGLLTLLRPGHPNLCTRTDLSAHS